jgi:hypothetical protein
VLFRSREQPNLAKFQITHRIEGIRVTEVTLPYGTELPEDWDTYGNLDKDEWLFEHQIYSKVRYEDVDFAEANAVERLS